MKRLFLISVIILNSCWISAQTTFTDAIAYNDFIVDHQIAVLDKIDMLTESMSADEVTIHEAYNSLLDRAKLALTEISALSDYNGNTEFRDAAINLFTFYVNTIEDDYAKLLEIVLKETITEEDEALFDQYVEAISANEEVYDEAFATAQDAFAAENGFELTDD